jgi:hypothetical protein
MTCERCGGPLHTGTRYCSRKCANQRPTTGLVMDGSRCMIICRDRTRVMFYRGVMAAKIGRLLTRDEHVHHVNGDPSDDRASNLRIVTRSEHMTLHQPEIQAGRR